MKIYGLQIDSVWETKAPNHDKVTSLLDRAKPEAGSLVVLGEMFATGFSMNVAAIHDSDTHETQSFLAQTAAKRKIFLLGGVVTKAANGLGRNESVVYSPKGDEIARYCKLQPFTLGGEKANYVAGNDVCLFNWQDFTVASFICYDLRFPEIFRVAANRGANLITVIASWPDARIDHWISLLKARAIENQAYVIGVNRCGNDPKLYHSGRSSIFDPSGKLLADAGSEEGWVEAEVSLASLLDYRNALPFLSDMRPEFVKSE
ncbi:MAG: carbon-nitrogen family hydrolase [Acidobacteria bacterium]|nr:carbon-nitrogen family hydrolase [Acidobacteriota bacterium]